MSAKGYSDGNIEHLTYSTLSDKACTEDTSLIDGYGTFAQKTITKGEVVFVKGGHILTRDQMYSLNKIDSYWPIDDNYVLAAKNKEEFSPVKLYINHSCSPNCGIRGDIVGVAMRDISVGEEITFDYAFLDNEDNRFKCTCGSPNCRHIVTGFDWQIKELQKTYPEYFITYLKEKIKAEFYYKAFTESNDEINLLCQEVFGNDTSMSCNENDYVHCCLYSKEQLVAYARVKLLQNEAQIDCVVVRQSERTKGYGRQIVFWAETEALKKDISNVTIYTPEQGVAFYSKLGYVISDKSSPQKSSANVQMKKKLALD